jgi:hypothetical protein
MKQRPASGWIRAARLPFGPSLDLNQDSADGFERLGGFGFE